jgi:GTPase Era involved in 16S rRNA processing
MKTQVAIEIVAELTERYQISAIRPLLETCLAAVRRSDLLVAVLGRFKAGKSSFLNHFIGRDVLPVGVIPVTSVVTEVIYGATAEAEIRFSDHRQIHVPLSELRSYVSEAENPDNRKGVISAIARVPEMSRWKGIRFVDTPGLESTFAHNTEAALAWAPNVDIALVAIGVDPPLTRQDLDLIAKLLTYTPRIAILLTKVDLLSETEQCEIIHFVHTRVAQTFEQQIPVYPYSTRSGYQHLRRDLEQKLMSKVAEDVAAERNAIVSRKVETLLRECEEYVRLTLKSAEMLDSDRLALRRQALTERDALQDTKLSIQLAARNAASQARPAIEKALALKEKLIRQELLVSFAQESTAFPKSFAGMLESFDAWLRAALSVRLAALSREKQTEFAQPLADLQRQYQRLLQNFRDRLSERTMALYGVPLHTTEPGIPLQPPPMPDIRVGHAFDHNWELVSPLIPMSLLRNRVLRRFRVRIEEEIFNNLSRLTSQWEEIITSTVFELQREAERRIEELVATVERLTSASREQASQIRRDLERLQQISEAPETKSA